MSFLLNEGNSEIFILFFFLSFLVSERMRWSPNDRWEWVSWHLFSGEILTNFFSHIAHKRETRGEETLDREQDFLLF